MYVLLCCKIVLCVCTCTVCAGAIREVWRSELKRQMSQRLAEERKAAEETKRFYNEDLPDEEVAEEAEFTDTSDEEFVRAAEDSGRESDACSDLDEQEGLVRVEAVAAEGPPDDPSREGCVEGGGSGEEGGGEEVEMDGYSGGDESDSDDCFSDNEDMPFGRSSKKKKKKSRQRLVDSDEEEEGERVVVMSSEDGGSGDSGISLVARQVEAGVTGGGRRRQGGMHTSNGGWEEASMGPLALNESFDNENTCTQHPTVAEDVAQEEMDRLEEETETSKLRHTVAPLTSPHSPAREKDGGRELEIIPNQLTRDDSADQTLENDDVTAGGEVGEGEREDERGGEGERDDASLAVPDSDRDNSLEVSLPWAPSLALAQPWRENTTTTHGATEEGEESQWPGSGYSQRFPDSQNASIDEGTQFLDANGSVGKWLIFVQMKYFFPPAGCYISTSRRHLSSSLAGPGSLCLAWERRRTERQEELTLNSSRCARENLRLSPTPSRPPASGPSPIPPTAAAVEVRGREERRRWYQEGSVNC